MYSERHYLSRSILAEELAHLPENISRTQVYLELSMRWKILAGAPPHPQSDAFRL